MNDYNRALLFKNISQPHDLLIKSLYSEFTQFCHKAFEVRRTEFMTYEDFIETWATNRLLANAASPWKSPHFDMIENLPYESFLTMMLEHVIP